MKKWKVIHGGANRFFLQRNTFECYSFTMRLKGGLSAGRQWWLSFYLPLVVVWRIRKGELLPHRADERPFPVPEPETAYAVKADDGTDFLLFIMGRYTSVGEDAKMVRAAVRNES